MKPISCLNCGIKYHGHYCSNCGQKATVSKLTWSSLLNELVHFFTHAEHSFIYTSKSLFTRPGHVIKEFLDGKRKKVHKPVTFVLVWFAIYKLADAGIGKIVKTMGLTLPRTESLLGIKWSGPRNETLLQNENLITIVLTAPILALLGWLVFRKTRTSFVERWVAILYGIAYTTILSLLLSLLGLFIKLVAPQTPTGLVNDIYFLVYFISIAWFIYGFERVYRTRLSKTQQVLVALLMSLVANYMADVIWYLLYWLIPPQQ